MALIPRAFKPSFVIRQRALRRGLLGPSLFWKVVAAWVFGKSTIKKFFGKQPDKLGTWKVGSNKFVNVINAQPTTRKQAKRAGTTKKARRELIIAQAVADAAAKHPGEKIVVKSK